VGTSKVTCVRTNVSILAAAGFRIKGTKSSSNSKAFDFIFPGRLLRAILANGLEYNGQEVKFDVVRTTPDNLSSVLSSITYAVLTTPTRHLGKHQTLTTEEKIEGANRIEQVSKRIEEKMSPLSEEEQKAMQRALRVCASEPSQAGKLARLVWGAHPIYRVALHGVDVRKYLPQPLHAFTTEKPSWSTLVKRDLLFTPIVLGCLSRNLARHFQLRGIMAAPSLANMLPPNAQRRNFVITDNEFIVSVVGKGLVSWVLSKHVLTVAVIGKGCGIDERGYPTVLCSGEVWRDEKGDIHVNANSGTFMPKTAQLQATAQLARDVFPGVTIIVEE